MNEKTGLIINQRSSIYFTPSPIQIFGGSSGWKTATSPDTSYSYIGMMFHTGAIKTTGELYLSGFNGVGALGDGTSIGKSSPVQTISGGTDWKNISVWNHTVATKTDGTLWTWGTNLGGQLGDFTRVFKSSPVQTIAAGTNWKQTKAGSCQTIAVKTDGSLWNWGRNTNGNLGNCSIEWQSSPVQTVSNTTNWKVSHAGFTHHLATKTDGTLWIWGRGNGGRLGNDTTISVCSPVQTISGGTDWTMISATSSGTMSLKTDGTLWNWGINFRGELGDNTEISKSSPIQTVAGGTNWKFLNGGYYRSAGIKTDGTLWIWGESALLSNAGLSILGCGNFICQVSSPVQTAIGGNDWKEVSLTRLDGLFGGGWVATKTDGTLWGSGYTGNGEKGNNAIKYAQYAPMDMGEAFIRKECFSDAGLFGVGANGQGQLGNNAALNRSAAVQTVSGGSSWRVISGGTCESGGAIKNDGTLWVWGRGINGRLGNLATTNRSSPVQTSAGGTNWLNISGGKYAFVATNTLGQLFTWGGGLGGILGNNGTANFSSPTQTSTGGTNWTKVASTACAAMALKSNGELWLWGANNFGQLGQLDTINRSTPTQTVAGGTNWTCIAMGRFSAAAIKADASLWVWGVNNDGQLGINNTNWCSSPVQTILNGCYWKQTAVGSGTIHSIKTDGTLWGSGFNGDGRLATSDNVTRSTPTQTVSGGTDWSKITASPNTHVGAIKADGTMWTWGSNFEGRLGTNDTVDRSSPTQIFGGGTTWKSIAMGYFETFMLREDCW